MRTAVLCALVLFGCSKKSEPEHEVETPPTAQPSEARPATPPAPVPVAPAPEAKPAAAPAVDCTALVTAEDFDKACNANVEIGPSQLEGKGNLMTCSRSVTAPGKKFPIARWGLSTFVDAAAAQSFVTLEKTANSKPITGIGDEAWTTTRANAGPKGTDNEVAFRKGSSVLKLGYAKDSLNKQPPCTLDQLVEIARAAAPRLP